MKHILRRLRAQFFALACLAAGQALASVSVSSTNGSGVPLGLAMPTLTFDIGADDPFSTLNVVMTYDSSMLTFRPDESTVIVGSAAAVGLNTFIAALQSATAPNFVANFSTPGTYGFTTFITPGDEPILVSGPVTITAAFALAGNFSGPAFVSYEGDISGDDFENTFSGTVTITAVPEPETWFLWIAGLGLLAGLSRRRQTPRRPVPQVM